MKVIYEHPSFIHTKYLKRHSKKKTWMMTI